MVDPAVWALMQRVETCRHHAESIERAADYWPQPWRDLGHDIARQWRQIAEQLYAVSIERDIQAAAQPASPTAPLPCPEAEPSELAPIVREALR